MIFDNFPDMVIIIIIGLGIELSTVILKALMPITFSSPRAQSEVAYFCDIK